MAAQSQPTWLWHGFLAAGNLTLLTSLWKSGKTTLVALLLNRRAHGGTLLGQAVTAGATVVVSEESASLWVMRQNRLDPGDRVCFFCRPFEGRPDLSAWAAFVDRLLDLRAEHGIDLVVIDPLALFLPAHEGSVAAQGAAGGAAAHRGRPGRAAPAPSIQGRPGSRSGRPRFRRPPRLRRHPPGNAHPRRRLRPRRRRLHGFSRYSETPSHLLLELNAAGDDYTILTESADDSAPTVVQDVLREILAAGPMTRDQISHAWLEDESPPPRNTLWRWLTRGCAVGLLVRTGAGTRSEPFRYALADAVALPPAS